MYLRAFRFPIACFAAHIVSDFRRIDILCTLMLVSFNSFLLMSSHPSTAVLVALACPASVPSSTNHIKLYSLVVVSQRQVIRTSALAFSMPLAGVSCSTAPPRSFLTLSGLFSVVILPFYLAVALWFFPWLRRLTDCLLGVYVLWPLGAAYLLHVFYTWSFSSEAHLTCPPSSGFPHPLVSTHRQIPFCFFSDSAFLLPARRKTLDYFNFRI